MNETVKQSHTHVKHTEAINEKENRRRVNRKYFYAAIIFGAAALMLTIWYMRAKAAKSKELDEQQKKEQQVAKELQLLQQPQQENTLQQQQQQKETQSTNEESDTFPAGEDEQSMFQLAKDIFKHGIRVYGSSRCGWTQRQRELFGGRDSPVRMAFESSYVECVSFDMCPGVEGFPSWKAGDQIYPGFRPPEAIRKLIDEVERTKQEKQAQKSMESAMKQAMERENAKKQERQEQQRAQEEESAEEDNNFNPTEAQSKSKRKKPSKRKELKMPSLPNENNLASEDDPSAASEDEPRVQILEEDGAEKNGTQKTKKKKKKEMVRGVTDYPPLNVPNMPGTAPMALASTELDYFEDQMRQGNLPRQSTENPNPAPAIAEQLAASLLHIEEQRKINTKEGQPHAAQVSSVGNPLGDKSINLKSN